MVRTTSSDGSRFFGSAGTAGYLSISASTVSRRWLGERVEREANFYSVEELLDHGTMFGFQNKMDGFAFIFNYEIISRNYFRHM